MQQPYFLLFLTLFLSFILPGTDALLTLNGTGRSSYFLSFLLAGPSLSNADFWFMPNNYSVSGILVKAVYVQNSVCQVDTESLTLAKGSPLLLHTSLEYIEWRLVDSEFNFEKES